MSAPPEDSQQWFLQEVQPVERSLRAYLRRSLPTESDAEDLLHDSYVRLLKVREQGRIRSTKPLLFAIARNAVRNFLERRPSRHTVPISEDDAQPLLEGAEGLVESVCRAQELALLAEAIEALPERCREVILLRRIQGYSQKEIASLLGISENTVESLAAKAVRRCGEYLRSRMEATERAPLP